MTHFNDSQRLVKRAGYFSSKNANWLVPQGGRSAAISPAEL